MGKKETFKFTDNFDTNADTQDIGNPLIAPTNKQQSQESLGFTSQDKEDYGKIAEGEDVNKLRVNNQSVGEQFGSWAVQSAGEIVGGAISGIGATLDIPDAIRDEYNNKDADFRNIITDAGDAISKWSKDVAPIYRQNPGKAFDVSDSGWWFESGVSVASTLALLMPAAGAVKGLSYVGKMLGLADELAVAGKLNRAKRAIGLGEEGFAANKLAINKIAGEIEKTKYFGKIATSAVVSRNAENFKESAQVLTSTKDNLLKEWDENPDKFKELLNSDVARELSEEGRPVDKENLANFIASKAAWLSYGVNSLNIGFDVLELSPLFKGFKPVTQISKLETSAAIKSAQKIALGETFSKFDRFTSALNPLSSAFARNATEGIEEAINYMGTKEGENYANKLTGKKTKDISGRIGEYLTDPKMYESAVWGVLGGVVFGGAASGLGSIANLVKGKDGNTLKEARISEINNRVAQIKATSEYIKQTENDTTIDDEEKKHRIANAKTDAITHLAINAAQVGNYNMLLEHLTSPEMKKQMLENNYANEHDVDKAITNSLSDAENAIDLYKSNYNLFQTRNIDDNTKNIQIAQKTYLDATSRKHFEQKNNLLKDIQILKANDNYLNTTTDKNVEATIQLTALELSKKSLENITENVNEPLSQYGKELLKTVNKKIENLNASIDEKANLTTLNPTILKKQVQVEQKNMIIEALGHKAKYMTTSAFSEKIKKDTENYTKKREEDKINEFKTNLDSEIKDNKHTVSTLETLKLNIKDNKQKEYIDTKIKEIKDKTTVKTREQDINNARDTEETNTTTTDIQETNKDTNINHDIFNYFKMYQGSFEKNKVDETKVNPKFKDQVDSSLQGENYDDLISLYIESTTSPLENKYIVNKILEAQENITNGFNVVKENVNLNTISDNTNLNNFEIDESAQQELENEQKPVLENVGIFDKTISEVSTSGNLKPFLHILKPLDFNGNIQITGDKKGLITDPSIDKEVQAAYNLKIGDKVEIKIDNTNSKFKTFEKDAENIPLAVYANGQKIAYLSTIRAFDYLSATDSIINGEEERQLLKNIRSEIGTDLNKKAEVIVNEVKKGTIINVKEYYSIKNLETIDENSIWVVKPGEANKHILTNLTTGQETTNNNELRYGIIYIGVKNTDGTLFPSPVKINKLEQKDAEIVDKAIFELLGKLNRGLSMAHDDVITLKDKIAGYIKIDDTQDDKTEQGKINEIYKQLEKLRKTEVTEEVKAEIAQKEIKYKELMSKRNISLRIYPKTEKPARIELGYTSPATGEKRILVIRETGVNVRGENNENLGSIQRSVVGLYFNASAEQQNENPVQKVLKYRYRNINFKQFRENKTYRTNIINSNVLQTNIGELRTSTGRFVSHFTDLNLRLTTEKEIKKEEIENKVVATVEDAKSNVNNILDDLLDFNKKVTETETKVNTFKDTNAKTLLEEIVKNPENQLIFDAATFALNAIDKNNIKVVYSDKLNTTNPASYNAVTNIITLSTKVRDNKETQEDILHEIYHALTVLPILKAVNFKTTKDNLDYNEYEYKKDTDKNLIKFFNNISELRKQVEQKIKQQYPDITKVKIEQKYGIENNFEFISEVIQNPEFREFLKDSDVNIIERILDAIVEFLNNHLGTNFNKRKEKDLNTSIKAILNFINSQKQENYSKLEQGAVHIFNSEFAEFKKEREARVFSNEELSAIINFTNYSVLKYLKAKNNLENIEEVETRMKDFAGAKIAVKETLQKAIDNSDKYQINLTQKALLEKAVENYDLVWTKTSSIINRLFQVNLEEDENIDLDKTSEIKKDWNSKSVDSLKTTAEIKWFLSTFTANSINPVTGLPNIIAYKNIINPLKKNLAIVQNTTELISKLKAMNILNPVYGEIASKLEQDYNLLNAFKTVFGGALMSSHVTLLKQVKDKFEATFKDENEFALSYIKIAREWQDVINTNIKSKEYKTEEFEKYTKELSIKLIPYINNRATENYLNEGGQLTKEGTELVNIFLEQAKKLGLNLSFEAIYSNVQSARNLDETIYSSLQGLLLSVDKNTLDNSTGNLRRLAKEEEKFNFIYTNLTGQNIKGDMVSAYQLGTALTNELSKLKSDNKSQKEKIERKYKEIVENDPSMQYSSLMWHETETDSEGKTRTLQLGLFNYEYSEGKKIPTSINPKFTELIGVSFIGGAKNTTSKEAFESTELSKLDNLINNGVAYLSPTENTKRNQNDFVYIPALTPSDSPSQLFFKLPRIKLKSNDVKLDRNADGDVTNVALSSNSNLYKSVENTVKQEVARRFQASQYMFDYSLSTNNPKLTNKQNLIVKPQYFDYKTDTLTKEGKEWFNTLQLYYHYKEVVYKTIDGKETNEIDLLNTLFTNGGHLTGRVFQYHNIKTLNKNEAFSNAYLTPLTITDFNSINKELTEYVNKIVLEEIKAWKDVKKSNILEEFYKHIGDGTFETFITEQTLNNYIGLIEQQNMFYGTTAEFKKDSDVAKRAKAPSAPGVSNVSSENVKSFTALTVSDINLKSAGLDFKINAVKEQLLIEQGYKFSKEDIDTFNINNVNKKTNKDKLTNKLEKEIYEILGDYAFINAGDAQGYMTVEGFEQVLEQQGKLTPTYKNIIEKLKSGEQLFVSEIKTIQAVKYLYAKNIYNPALQKMNFQLIKNSYTVLIPQLTTGSELDEIRKILEEKKIGRMNFQSAHKVGSSIPFKISDENGNLNTEWLRQAEGKNFEFDGEQEQLNVPDHLRDNNQLVATQISKLVMTNLSNEAIYELDGKKLTGDQIKSHYFKLWTANIEDSKDKLVEKLEIITDKDGTRFKNAEAIHKVLLEEINKRGESEVLRQAIELVNGEFKLPLFTGQNADKFESILTSLFTNGIMKQKAPGATVVNVSDLFTKKITQDQYKEESTLTEEQSKNIDDLKSITPEYSQFSNEDIQYAIEQLIPDSKVKEVVFHGTKNNFTEFSDDYEIHFSDTLEYAKSYGKIIPSIINIQNPLIASKDDRVAKFKKSESGIYDGEKEVLTLSKDVENTNYDGLIGIPVYHSNMSYIPKSVKQITILNSPETVSKIIDIINNKPKETKREKGIEWQKGHDGVLKSYREEDGQTQVIEVVMGAWSSKFFKDGNRVSIDTIPDEIKTMIGYRIPTSGKNLMVVFKVVGFLPEEGRGSIIMPNDVITQMGLDFDIDKMYVMYKHFNINKKGNFNVPKYGTKEEFDFLSNDLKELRGEKEYLLNNDNQEAYITSIDNEITNVADRLKELGYYNEEKNQFLFKEHLSNKQARNNSIIDIYKSILTNKEHLKELFTPVNYNDLKNFKTAIQKLQGTNDENIDIHTAAGQRAIKDRNMLGSVLKGASANMTAFLSIGQPTNMQLDDSLSFPVKYKIKGTPNNEQDVVYDLKQLQALYSEIKVEGDFATIYHKAFGKTSKGLTINADGNVITEVANQTLAAAVDNSSDPVLDGGNLSTFTFQQYQTGVSVGAPSTHGLAFTVQPVIKALNASYFEAKGLITPDTESRSREKVRNKLESLLFNALINKGVIKGEKKISKKTILNNPKTFSKQTREKYFEYDLDTIVPFTQGELWGMLEQNAKWKFVINVNNGIDLDEKIQYLRNQLFVLNQFNRQRKAGEATQDLLRTTKVDGLGAGPSLNNTEDLFTLINKVKKDNKIKIGEDSAIESLYPKYFKLDIESVYSPLESLLMNVNVLAYNALNDIFIESKPGFRVFKSLVYNPYTKNKKGIRIPKKFYNKTLLEEFELFNKIEISTILGLSGTKNEKLNITIEEFNNLSVANQHAVILDRNKKMLSVSYNHILNALSYELNIEKFGYQKLIFNSNYKDVDIDDTFSQQLEDLYFTGDKFNKAYVTNLIKYSYHVNGLEFTFNSLTKVISPDILEDLRLTTYYKTNKNKFIEPDVDFYKRNNFKNSEIVSLVSTKVQKNEDGTIKKDNDNYILTVNNTPIWDASQDVLIINTNSLYNETQEIANNPYIRLVQVENKKKIILNSEETNEETENITEFTNKVYKKYNQNLSLFDTNKYKKVTLYDFKKGLLTYDVVKTTFEDSTFILNLTRMEEEKKIETKIELTEDNIDFYTENLIPIPEKTYYYRVNTLGKDGITELSDKSLFEENNVTNEEKNLQDLENTFNKVKINSIQIDIQMIPKLYSELGNKTTTNNIVIKSVYQQEGIAYAKSINGVFSLRVNNSEKHFGNPFSSVQSEINKGLIAAKSTKEAVEKYIDWVINSKDNRAEWIREQLKSGNLKNRPIVYYKELGEPSHATALDYLINKYNWNNIQTTLNLNNISKEDTDNLDKFCGI